MFGTRGSLPLVCCALCCWVSGSPETDLRTLLLTDPNQEVMERLGTGYEIVYPHQIRKDWGRGLSTHLAAFNGTRTHVPETTLLIETLEYKLHLDLELNTKLIAPTLVQVVYLKDASPVTAQKLPENCFYHATVRNHPGAKAAFKTCHGIRGIIYLKEKTFFILPVHGDRSGKSPHFLYHVFPKDDLLCGNAASSEQDSNEKEEEIRPEGETWQRKKYIETALVLDRSLYQKFGSRPPSDVLAAAVEIVNCVDLLYRPLNTAVSLVYLELWIEDPIESGRNASATLDLFKEYVTRRISRISVDAAHMLTSVSFEPGSDGLAFLDGICTNDAVGLTRVEHPFQPHVTASVLAHMLGHNLGMGHDRSAGCECAGGGCIMDEGLPIPSATEFSECSLRDYRRTLDRGYGACLYNMPTMRTSICGNGISEESEQCDCGTVQECAESDPCCDPSTCRLVTHAQCSSGPCCKKCKLLSPDHLCRPSKGECDIPEFCDGTSGECPSDLFRKNGAVCFGGLGYCYQGACPVLKHQCEDVWGQGAESADSICFEKLNVLGTPNGNCGTDDRGEIAKCTEENSPCGFLQCGEGEKTSSPPGQFVVHKIVDRGTVHKCKARTLPTSGLTGGLVKDGTKCGYQKSCINRTCTSLKSLATGKCPAEEFDTPCSGHGMCTNVNSCFCEEGWKGPDCSEVDEDAGHDAHYYDSAEGGYASEIPYYGENEMKLNPNLALTAIAASVVIGVGLVVIVVLIFFYRYT